MTKLRCPIYVVTAILPAVRTTIQDYYRYTSRVHAIPVPLLSFFLEQINNTTASYIFVHLSSIQCTAKFSLLIAFPDFFSSFYPFDKNIKEIITVCFHFLGLVK